MASIQLKADALVLDGRFKVLERLGAGGMGEVYLAEQVSLGRKVAIKVLRSDLSQQPGMLERFKREARLLSAVEHPSVVRVIDFGQSGDASCLVMELVEGETLKKALHHGPFAPERALKLLQQLADGLAAIHEKGIVHRDLKPENVVLSAAQHREQARLLDFGIARLAEPDSKDASLSQVGLVIGTPEYLSPEQAVGGVADARSDLYSFGVLAYRMLAGVLPFPGPTSRQFLAQHVSQAPRPLWEAAPHLAPHRALCEQVMQCLEKTPAQRPQSAAAFAQALHALSPLPDALAPTSLSPVIRAPLATSKLVHRAAGGFESFWKRRRVTAIGALTAVLVAGGYAYWRSQPGPKVERLLDDGRAAEALALVTSELQQAPQDEALRLLRARALHGLDRHREEHELIGGLSTGALSDASDAAEKVLGGVAADFGDQERSTTFKETLEHFRKAGFESHLVDLAEDSPSLRQWGALRFLDLAGTEKSVDWVNLYSAALTEKDCQIRATAAMRLGELADPDAEEPLKDLIETPRPKRLGIFEGSCGHDEAHGALRAIRKKQESK